MIDIDSEFECSTHSDDVVYTAERCEHYDDNLCEGRNTNWDEEFPVPCSELAWCSEFCGDACDAGTGGLCMLRLLSDLEQTCAFVSEKVVALHGDPAVDDPSHEDIFLHRGEPFVGHGDHIDGGCGYHALCTECVGDCKVSVVQDYFFTVFGQSMQGLTPTVAPAPHVKFALFAQPLETCDQFGLLSSEALSFKNVSPSEWSDPGQWMRTVAVLIAVPSLVVAVLSMALLVHWKDKPWVELVRRVREDSSGYPSDNKSKERRYGVVSDNGDDDDNNGGDDDANGYPLRGKAGVVDCGAAWYSPVPQTTTANTSSAAASTAAAAASLGAVPPPAPPRVGSTSSGGGDDASGSLLLKNPPVGGRDRSGSSGGGVDEEDLLHLLGSNDHAEI